MPQRVVGVDDILRRLDLTDVADTLADTLPSGIGRLVEVARALAADPGVILLDEPAAGQDHEETERFSSLLGSVADEGVAVLLVEHDMDLVMSVCDTVHVLDLGKIICVGTPDAVRTDPVVLAAYLGEA